MRWLRHLVLSFVALCVGAQGVALSAERALGRAHYHQADVVALDRVQQGHRGDLDGHRYAPQIEVSAGHPDDHSTVAHHDHDAAAPGVIEVAQDSGASTLNPHSTLVRSIHDIDLLVPLFQSPADDGTAQGWTWARHRPLASHVSHPLERPPRA